MSALYDFSGDPHRPNDADIAAALAHAGWEKITLDGERVTYGDPEAVIDLGSVAKGWIDRRHGKQDDAAPADPLAALIGLL